MKTITFDRPNLMTGVVLIFCIVAGFLGGLLTKRPIVMCNHSEPFEIEVTGGGMMLIVPSTFYAIQIEDKYKRNYVKPTDEG